MLAIDPEAARSDECPIQVLVCSFEPPSLFEAAPYRPLIVMPTAAAFKGEAGQVAVGQIDITNPLDEAAACSGASGPFVGQLEWDVDALDVELAAATDSRGSLTIFALASLLLSLIHI